MGTDEQECMERVVPWHHSRVLVPHRFTLTVAYWCGVLSTIVFAVVYGWHSWLRYQEEGDRRLALVAAMIAAATHDALNSQASQMAFLAERLRQMRGVGRTYRTQVLLREFERVSPAITDVALVTPTDQVVAAARPAALGFRHWHDNPQLQAVFRRSLRTPGLSLCRPLYNVRTHKWIIYATYPVRRRRTGMPWGVIVERLGFHAFGRVFSRLPLMPGLAVGLLRDDFYFEARKPVPSGNLRALLSHPQHGVFARLLAFYPDRNGGVFSGYVTADHEYRFGAYARVRGYPLVAFADIPRAQRLLSWWSREAEIPLGFLVIALAFSALAYYRIQVLTRRWEAEREHQKSILRSLAVHDPLTGLLNRANLTPVLKRAVDRARRYERLLAIGFLDVNDFKFINDLYGHPTGDAVLKELARRLSEAVRATDRVVRLGGDEFVLVIEGLQTIADLEIVIDHVHKTLSRVFVINDASLDVHVSLGLTVYPMDDDSIDSLLRHADQAMYTAKTYPAEGWVRMYDPQRPRPDHAARPQGGGRQGSW